LFQHASKRLGLLTDTGHITPHIRETLLDCDGLVLEFNHDREMLIRGPYPPSLQARVGGCHGHLSNDQAAELLQQLPLDRLRYLLASHLSEKNNHREKVGQALIERLPGLMERLHFASQDEGGGWYEID
jgi:phosphoribosyl 1,2-cyclic phosphodiesterase